MYPRISINPNVCHGQACIKGTRIPIHQIIHMLANGGTIEELLAEYPSLKQEDILTCRDYAASLAKLRPLRHWRVQHEYLRGREHTVDDHSGAA